MILTHLGNAVPRNSQISVDESPFRHESSITELKMLTGKNQFKNLKGEKKEEGERRRRKKQIGTKGRGKRRKRERRVIVKTGGF